MKRALIKFLLVFVIFAAVFVLQKPLFMGVYASELGLHTTGDWLQVMWHGLSMDFTMAGYLSVIPGLLIIAMLWTRRPWPQIAMEVYIALAAAAISAVMCLDLVLYSYWGFRIDMTPIFYFASSPSSAMASTTWWQVLLGSLGFLVACALMWWVIRRVINSVTVKPVRRWSATAAMAVAVAALFLPIRGSLTTSTMNPSRAYFSQRRGLNHAATNPAFNLLYSASHQSDFDSAYRFLTPEEAAANFAAMMRPVAAPDTTAAPLTTVERPDIVIVILESFSTHLMPSFGGEPIALGLDSIAGSGLLFTNFYANSFRTDRAIPAILSALPAQPATSIVKYSDKLEHLPSLAASFAREGYEPSYFYGGDIHFGNMMTYLLNAGYRHIVSDKDFPLKEKLTKWGAPDEYVFDHAARYLKADPRSTKPRFAVVQTLSSHEPFEVPYSNPRFADNIRANAFAYTDSTLTVFVNSLKKSPRWHRTLVVLVPDHYGCWPKGLTRVADRHHIPLVITGGALSRRGRVESFGSQTDIAATLLRALGLPHDEFIFSRDLLKGNTPQVAMMTEPSTVALATPGGSIVWNCDADETEASELTPAETPLMRTRAQAWLQTLYQYIDSL